MTDIESAARYREWLDSGGYPTEAALEKARTVGWMEFLPFLEEAWNTDYGSARAELRDCERALVDFSGGSARFLRLATGGWSGNEDLLGAVTDNVAYGMTWALSSRGGLHIFRYPEKM